MKMRGWLRNPPVLGSEIDEVLAARLQWTPAAMHTWATERLQRRLRLAQSVPAWREASGGPSRRAERLEAFPLLQRGELVGGPDRYLDPRWPRRLLRVARTSGSTGRPVTLLRDPASILLEEAFLRRQLAAFGWRGGSSLAIRADGPRDPESWPIVRSRSRNEWCVAASRLDARTVRAVVEHGVKHRVGLLRGYPSALTELARRIEGLGLEERLVDWPLRLLHLSSEDVTPAASALLRRVFGVPVAEQYGQAERVLLIQTCPRGSRHLMLDYGWGEVVEGEWIATPLHGAMVLIRYRTGDGAQRLMDGATMAPAAACGCGWPFPVVGPIQGRADDYVETHDGRRVGRVGPALSVPEGIAWAQLDQQSDLSIHVRFGGLPGCDLTELGHSLERSLRDLLRDQKMRIVLLPGALPVRDPSGKVRAVRSVDHDR